MVKDLIKQISEVQKELDNFYRLKEILTAFKETKADLKSGKITRIPFKDVDSKELYRLLYGEADETN